jgi:hypothetical protein
MTTKTSTDILKTGDKTKHHGAIAIHTATYDIDEAALGISIPKRYYLSPGIIGTVAVYIYPEYIDSIAHRLITAGSLLRKYKQPHGFCPPGKLSEYYQH